MIPCQFYKLLQSIDKTRQNDAPGTNGADTTGASSWSRRAARHAMRVIKESSVKTILAASSLAVALSFMATADANAWSRSKTVTGPRGTSTVTASGACANGVCSRQVTRTGPYGNSVSRQGSAQCAGGVCTTSSVTTGPYGGTRYRSSVIYR
jgi:hypothetical protein